MSDQALAQLRVRRKDLPNDMPADQFIEVVTNWHNIESHYRGAIWWDEQEQADDDATLEWTCYDAPWGMMYLDELTDALAAGGIAYVTYDGGHYTWNAHEWGWKPGMDEGRERTCDVEGNPVLTDADWTRLIGRAARRSLTKEGTGNILADNIIVIGQFFTSNDPADW